MSRKPKILAFAGSLRKDSTNKKLAQVAASGAEKAGADVKYIDLLDYPMPIYNGDDEERHGLPENVIKLKNLMREADGFIISSPEYNSSISAALKNLIDWTSRKESKDEKNLVCFVDKVALIVSASPGNLGGLRGLVHLRAILENIQTFVLPSQKTISNSYEAFDANGQLKDAEAQKAVENLGKKLTETVKKLIRV